MSEGKLRNKDAGEKQKKEKYERNKDVYFNNKRINIIEE